MDPLTQGIVGAAAAQSLKKKNNIIIITLLGFLAGLAPDIDIFIRSKDDPLLFLEYHRHFTHSLIFIPVGGLICSIVFYFVFSRHYQLTFAITYLYSTLGYATHGIIDSLTTYGTQLLWPFADTRIAFNTISVIDPLFTVPIVLLVILAMYNNNSSFAMYAIIWVISYQSIAYIQKERAEASIERYAISQGHKVDSIEAKPSFGNIVLWKVIYTHENNYYINAIRLGYNPKIFSGTSIQKIDIKKDFTWLDKDSQQYKDIERFNWFSNGYLAFDQQNKNIIYDIRFSSLPNSAEGLWGIKVDKNKRNDSHVEYITNRNRSGKRFYQLLEMIFK